MYAFLLDDFILQWISVLFLLLGFVIPFVFMVELLPLPLIVMFSIAGMLVIVVVAQKQSAMMPKKIKKIKKPETAKTPTAEAAAPAAAAATETADAAASSEATSDSMGEAQATDAANAEANEEKNEEKNEETEKKS